MADAPLITLTTDFGTDSPYVAQMKGVLLQRLPDVRIVDLTHAIPAQQVATAAYVLADSLRWFPAHAVHVAVVDPGVGTDRKILAGRLVGGGRVVGPDNGLWTHCEFAEAYAVDDPRYWLPEVSRTFHGRDIMAPVAASIAAGLDLRMLGSPIAEPHRLAPHRPISQRRGWLASVLFADHFGNLITNATEKHLGEAKNIEVDSLRVPVVATYGDAAEGELVALIGSSGRLEVAVVGGNAAARLGTVGRLFIPPPDLPSA